LILKLKQFKKGDIMYRLEEIVTLPVGSDLLQIHFAPSETLGKIRIFLEVKNPSGEIIVYEAIVVI
jgi:hypothetical protein